jgi:RNA polymerase-binding transcription factor DksA
MDARVARRMLEHERERLQGLLEAARTARAWAGLGPALPGDDADAGERRVEYELAESMRLHALRELYEVDEALARIHADTYGACEVCRAPIGDERLQARPATRTCVSHADSSASCPS